MPENCLDFEKPIADLENKLEEWQKLSESSNIDVHEEVDALTKKLNQTMKEIYENLTPWQRVQLARHPKRPYTLDYINLIFTDFLELHGDRHNGDDAAIVGGFAKLDGNPVMIVGTQKGRDMKENMYRNFGLPQPEGYRKAMRLMKLADKAGVPVITMIDTPGAFPGIESEERHIAEAIATNLRDMFTLKVPIVSVVIGEGGSGGAIGIGVGNKILVMENSYYSVISPEGCAAILWKHRRFAPKAAEALNLTATHLKDLGVADEIVDEPLGGAHKNYENAATLLKKALKRNLAELGKLSAKQLKDQRYDKFRKIGEFSEGIVE